MLMEVFTFNCCPALDFSHTNNSTDAGSVSKTFTSLKPTIVKVSTRSVQLIHSALHGVFLIGCAYKKGQQSLTVLWVLFGF
jgi:hypothetical protein